LTFSPDLDRLMLAALRTHPDNDAMFEDACDEGVRSRYRQLKKGWLPPTYEGRQAKLRGAISVQRSYLLEGLHTNELWAIGCRTLPNGHDELVRVPRTYFFTDYTGERDVRPNVYWAKSELITERESYFAIRVVRAPTSNVQSADVVDGDHRSKGTSVTKLSAAKARGRRTKQARRLPGWP
jgi:hypothetical protein